MSGFLPDVDTGVYGYDVPSDVTSIATSGDGKSVLANVLQPDADQVAGASDFGSFQTVGSTSTVDSSAWSLDNMGRMGQGDALQQGWQGPNLDPDFELPGSTVSGLDSTGDFGSQQAGAVGSIGETDVTGTVASAGQTVFSRGGRRGGGSIELVNLHQDELSIRSLMLDTSSNTTTIVPDNDVVSGWSGQDAPGVVPEVPVQYRGGTWAPEINPITGVQSGGVAGGRVIPEMPPPSEWGRGITPFKGGTAGSMQAGVELQPMGGSQTRPHRDGRCWRRDTARRSARTYKFRRRGGRGGRRGEREPRAARRHPGTGRAAGLGVRRRRSERASPG